MVIPVDRKDVRKLETVEVERQDSARRAGAVPGEEEHVGEDREPVAGIHVVPQNLVDFLEAVDQTDVGEHRPQRVLR